MSDYHQFGAVVSLAIVPSQGDEDHGVIVPRGAPLADRARPAVSRVGRSGLEVRDALLAVLDAVAGLERNMERMHSELVLRDHSIELTSELVLIGADGIELQRAGPWPDGQEVRIYLVLDVRDVQHLLSLRGTVTQREEGASIAFRDLRGDQKDLIVAFVFQQEAKERRRALSSPG